MRKRRSKRRTGVDLFRIGPITVTADFSWFVVVALLTFVLAQAYAGPGTPARAMGRFLFFGLLGSLGLFASVLVHELSHSALSWWYGNPVRRIRLFIFGGVSELSQEPDRPGHEFVIAAAGPLTSLVLAALAYGASAGLAVLAGGIVKPGENAASEPSGAILAGLLYYLAYANTLLALFNLIPGFPLDGGRCLRAILWARRGDFLRATATASRMGKVVAIALVAWGFLGAFQTGHLFAAWPALVGMFLHMAAASAYRAAALRGAFAGARVRDIMVSSVVTVEADLPVDRLVEDYFLRFRYSGFPVVREGRPAGVVTMNDLAGLPRDRWAATPTEAIAHSLDGASLDPDDTVLAAFRKMGESGLGSIPVVREGQLLGLVTRRDLLIGLLRQGLLTPEDAQGAT